MVKNKLKFPLSSFHWGTYRVETQNNELLALHPFEEDPDASPIAQGYLGVLNDSSRITRPMIRKSWLEGGPGAHGDLRGKEEFVAVSWGEAEKLIADELNRVRDTYGNKSIFAGSYGWASAGRFHHAQGHLKRFLNLLGGFTRSVNSYSLAAGEVILPHVLGSDDFINNPSSWQSIIDHCDLMVAFGGLPLKNSAIAQGGVGAHRAKSALLEAKAAGVEFINVSPMKSDVPTALDAQWLAPRPSTDAALMLGLAHVLLSEGLINEKFIQTYTTGFEQFSDYLLGKADGVAKTAEWASEICELTADDIRALARKMAQGRTMISIAWSLTRQDHGEQPFWLGIMLASMLGQIGLPGGGVGFGYCATNMVGLERPMLRFPALPQGQNPIDSYIPVARITEMLENPGGTFEFNGKTLKYPETKLIWWAGGNPFHHHQDLNRLRRAWTNPDTIVVNEWCWNSVAKHADIVLPCTTPLERNDLTLSKRDPYLIVMHKVLTAPREARDDFEIFRGLARHMGFEKAYTENRDEDAWLKWLYEQSRQSAAKANCEMPAYDELQDKGWYKLDVPTEPYVMLSEFRENPSAHPLRTPSGKIELFSETIASFGYDDCPGHPVWIEPLEWLGSSEGHQLHLISNQPKNKLHSQLDHGPLAQSDRISGHEPALLNSSDAGERGISDGDLVLVSNARGACFCRAILSEVIRPGVVQISTGAWFDPDANNGICRAGNPNVLTLDKGTSQLAQGPTAHSCLVTVEYVES